MTIVSYSSASVASGFTQAQLMDSVKTQLIACGWSSFDDYSVSGERNLVFRLIHDSTKTQGTVFVRIQCSSAFALTLTIGTAWNTTTKVMTNVSSSMSIGSLVSTSAVKVNTYNGFPELSGVTLEQLSTYLPIVSLFVSDRAEMYDLNAWTASFLFNSNTFNSLQTTTLNPYSSSAFPLEVGNANLSVVNRINNRREVRQGVIVGFPSTEGGLGRTSDDLAQGTCTGLSRGNEIVDDSVSPNRRFQVLNAAIGGFMVRVA